MQNIEKQLFFIFYSLFIIFFIIPEPLQKLFRVLLGLFLLGFYSYIVISGNAKRFLPRWHFIYFLGNIILTCLVIYKGHWQSSIINVFLFSLGILVCSKEGLLLTERRVVVLKRLSLIAMCSMMGQFIWTALYRESRGLLYEINLSGVYILLFIICMDIIKFRFAVIVGCLLAFLVLSRLTCYSIVIYFILKMLPLNRYACILSWGGIIMITLTLFFWGNFYFLDNANIMYSYRTDWLRLFEVRDGSNFLRFSTNVHLWQAISPKNFDQNLHWGYGSLGNHLEYWYEQGYKVMPHNELLCCLAESGIYYMIWNSFWITLFFSRIYSSQNYFMMLVALFISLFLWVKVVFIPSPEMLFFVLLLIMIRGRNISSSSACNDLKALLQRRGL